MSHGKTAPGNIYETLRFSRARSWEESFASSQSFRELFTAPAAYDAAAAAGAYFGCVFRLHPDSKCGAS